MIIPAVLLGMRQTFNVYCDESGHLENDRVPNMVLGALKCHASRTREVAQRIREIKERHGIAKWTEIKWSKVSPSKTALYVDLVDYFFDTDALSFRALVAPKGELDHAAFGNNHDEWYYRMFFTLLRPILPTTDNYNVYLDIKDTRSIERIRELRKVLCSALHDFSGESLQKVEHVRSHEVEQMQLVDLLIGATSYVNREIGTNSAKTAVVKRVVQRGQVSLTSSSSIRRTKVNVFHWRPQDI